MPLIVRPKFKGLIREASSGVENGYGGLVSAGELTPEQVKEAYVAVKARFPNLRIYGNPHETYINTPMPGPHQTRIDSFTQSLPILEPPLQRKRMNESQRKRCKRGERHGFTEEIIESPDPTLTSLFYDLYQAHNAS